MQFIRFGGTADTDGIVDHKRISGTLLDQSRQLDELARLHVALPLALGSEPRHAVTPDYPEAALRQVLRNAIMHRSYEGTHAPVRFAWYSDRIEVLSPGGPFGQVSIESFGEPGLVDYRNPAIAEAMRALGLVERFGIGLQIVRSTMRDNGNPEPDFIATSTHCLVVLRRRP